MEKNTKNQESIDLEKNTQNNDQHLSDHENQKEPEHILKDNDSHTEQIKKLETEKEELNNQLLRTIAEFQNFRKRSIAERENIRKLATENLVIEILPVLDNFERTLTAIESGADMESLKSGVEMVYKQLHSALKSTQLIKIESSNSKFEPELHEAISIVEQEGFEKDQIIEVIQEGYKLGDKIIRPARVKVAK